MVVDSPLTIINYITSYHSSGQTAKEVHDSSQKFVGSRTSKVTRAASSELFPRKNVNTKWHPVGQTCKSMSVSRRKRAAACFLTAIGQ